MSLLKNKLKTKEQPKKYSKGIRTISPQSVKIKPMLPFSGYVEKVEEAIPEAAYDLFGHLDMEEALYEQYLGEFESNLADRINKLNDILLLINDAKSLEKQVRKELKVLIKALGDLTKQKELGESTPIREENKIDLTESKDYSNNIDESNIDLEDFK